MSLLVDTSVWSLALRRNAPADTAHVATLQRALAGQELVMTTGVIVQEVLQGTLPTATRSLLLERFANLGFVTPDRGDHIWAADLRNECRTHGVQLGTIDALIAAISIRHGLTLLTSGRDFDHASRWVPLHVWRAT